jgi:hypothetical protein
MTEQHVLLWSQTQNALHIETLAKHASLNRAAYADNTPGDFRLLVVGTRAEVEATAANIRPTMALRDVVQMRSAA